MEPGREGLRDRNDESCYGPILRGSVLGIFFGFILVTTAKNRGEICDLRLAAAQTDADSTAIYEDKWSWALPIARCPRETPKEPE